MKASDFRCVLTGLAIGFLALGCEQDQGIGDGALEEPGVADQASPEEPIGEDAPDIGADEQERFGDTGIGESGPGGAGPVEPPPPLAEPGSTGGADTGIAVQYPPFEELDTNSDGELSRLELAQVEGLDYDALDTDQDDSVSQEEYAAAAH